MLSHRKLTESSMVYYSYYKVLDIVAAMESQIQKSKIFPHPKKFIVRLQSKNQQDSCKGEYKRQ